MFKSTQISGQRVPTVKSALLYVILYLVIGALVVLIPLKIITLLMPETLTTIKGASAAPQLIAISQALSAVTVAWLINRKIKKNAFSAKKIGLRWPGLRATAKYVALFPVYQVLTLLVLVITLAIVSTAFGFEPPDPNSAGAQRTKTSALNMGGPLAVFFFVFMAPVFEELLMRGVLFSALRARFRFVSSTAITSLVFGLAHLNPIQIITASLVSPYLCYVREKTGSIYPCILIHAVWNGLITLVIFRSAL